MPWSVASYGTAIGVPRGDFLIYIFIIDRLADYVDIAIEK
jgi:hypothetical protein